MGEDEGDFLATRSSTTMTLARAEGTTTMKTTNQRRRKPEDARSRSNLSRINRDVISHSPKGKLVCPHSCPFSTLVPFSFLTCCSPTGIIKKVFRFFDCFILFAHRSSHPSQRPISCQHLLEHKYYCSSYPKQVSSIHSPLQSSNLSLHNRKGRTRLAVCLSAEVPQAQSRTIPMMMVKMTK